MVLAVEKGKKKRNKEIFLGSENVKFFYSKQHLNLFNSELSKQIMLKFN